MATAAQLLVSGILSGGVYALVGVGLALIFGVAGLVNFAHGEYLMIAMYLSWLMYDGFGAEPYVSAPLVLAAMAAAGFVSYRIVMARAARADHAGQMLITLALSMILQNLALILWKADYRTVRVDVTNEVWNAGFLVLSVPRVVAFAAALLATLLLSLFLRKTYTGTAMRAVAQNGRAAQLMGISLGRIYGLAFVTGTVTVGLAGVLLSPIYPVHPLVGAGFSTLAFIVVVLGGLTNVEGAVAGGLLIGVIESFTGYFAGPAYQQAAYFLLFIVVLVLRPSGLFGKGARA